MTTQPKRPKILPGGKGRGRGGSAAFVGRGTRNYLLEHGQASPTEIHQYINGILSVATTGSGDPWRRSTWKSHWNWFRLLVAAGLVEKVGTRDEVPTKAPFLVHQTLYQLTNKGRQQEDLWTNVRKTLYPVSEAKRSQYSLAARTRKAEKKQRRLAYFQAAAPAEAPPPARRPRAPARRPRSEEARFFAEQEAEREIERKMVEQEERAQQLKEEMDLE